MISSTCNEKPFQLVTHLRGTYPQRISLSHFKEVLSLFISACLEMGLLKELSYHLTARVHASWTDA
jgi:hypothetical protein